MTEPTTTGPRVRWWSYSGRTPDRSWAFTAVWLVFLAYPIVSLLNSGQSVLRVIWGLALIALFAATYVVAATHIMSWKLDHRRPRLAL
ncbi:MAG: hypothetical protein INR72_13315, partial [Williamsia herbipolensis]|nr:hypothetical protein [Williamsia herbipolensis]